jgi:hypothetical protein
MILLFSAINGYLFGQIMTMYHDFSISLNFKKIQIILNIPILTTMFSMVWPSSTNVLFKKLLYHGTYYQFGAKNLQPNLNFLSRLMISINMEINK